MVLVKKETQMSDTIGGAIIGSVATLLGTAVVLVGNYFAGNRRDNKNQKELRRKLASGLMSEIKHILDYCERALVSWDEYKVKARQPFPLPFYTTAVPFPKKAIYESNISLLTFFAIEDMRALMTYYQRIDDSFRMYSEYCAYAAYSQKTPSAVDPNFMNQLWQSIWSEYREGRKQFTEIIEPMLTKYLS